MKDLYDIVIVGAGLIGLSTAALFAKSFPKANILLLDRSSKDMLSNPNADGRTTAISLGSKMFYEDHGLWDGNLFKAEKISDIVITRGFQKIHYDSELVNEDAMGYNVDNSLMKKHLYNKNIEFGVEIISEVECIDISSDSDRCTLKLSDGKEINSKLLLACDGKNSKIREMLKIDCISYSYGQRCLAFNIKHDLHHNYVAYERFLDRGPFAILPMYGGYTSSIIWSDESNMVEMAIDLPESEFIKVLKNKMGGVVGDDITLATKPISYTLSANISKKLVHGNIVLLGDSAQSIHPVAGQGFNIGLKGVKILLDRVSKYVNLGMDFNYYGILSGFTREVKIDNYPMICGIDFIVKYLGKRHIIFSSILNTGINIVDRSNTLKRFLINKAMGF